MKPGPPLRVALIGCGLIGSRWDAARTDEGPSLTHGRAFSRIRGVRVVACCDADGPRAREAAALWGQGAAAAYTEPEALFAAQAVDLAVVASASGARAAGVLPALRAGVRMLVIEKPLAGTLAESRTLLAALDAAGARALINYSRHWDPSMLALARQLQAGEFGAVQRLVGTYGKGLSNNGSHLIDLARLLCDARPMRARALGSPLAASEADWSQGHDPALDAQIELSDGAGRSLRLDLMATDRSAYTCFELRIFGTQGLCEISQGGRSIDLRALVDDPDYPGYRIPGPRRPQPAQALQSMDRMAAEAVGLVRDAAARPSCDAAHALLTASTVAAVQRSATEGGRWVAVEAACESPLDERTAP
jgi:predicted dehydrogenase